MALTKQTNIADFRRVHGEKYNYGQFRQCSKEYKVVDKIPIICRKHGVFYQSILSHKRGHGCPTCALEQRGAKARDGQPQNAPKKKALAFNERLLTAESLKKNPQGWRDTVTRDICAGIIKKLPLHKLQELFNIKYNETEHGGTLVSVSLK